MFVWDCGCFDEENGAVDNISFGVSVGDMRILIGGAGAGKTVVLKTALGLLPAQSGCIFVFGREISGMAEEQLFTIRSKIGMLFQESALFDSMTIEDNVAYPLLNQRAIQYPAKKVEERCKEALRF